MKKEELQQKLCEQLCADIKLIERENGTWMISVPFSYPDGDRYSIYLKDIDSEQIRLSDGANTMMRLSYDTPDVSKFFKGNRGKLMEQILRETGVQKDGGEFGGEFYVKTTADKISEATSRLTQALSQIYDLSYLNRDRSPSTFYEDVDQVAEPRASYGGDWTRWKLETLEKYLNAYTTVLKNQPFKLVYIDAFAGSGSVELRDKDKLDLEAKEFLAGSVQRALQVKDKPFDKLLFVEKDADRCESLKQICSKRPDRDTEVINKDANDFLRNLNWNWVEWRGVLFLDPFATEVEWSTIEKIATFNALDTWILFPVSAIARMLPKSKRPEDISDSLARRLTSIYGDESWKGLYRPKKQLSMFEDELYERNPGVEGLSEIYKKNLERLFRKRYLSKSKILTNSTNSPLFEFIFCVGNEKGIGIAKRIAEHILKDM